jgi:hypothetical protein
VTLALLLLVASSDPGRPEGPSAPVPWIRCTSTTIELPPGVEQRGQPGTRPVENPIAAALEQARPGTVIQLEPGDYPAFTIGFQSNSPANAVTAGGQPGNPVVVEGFGVVRVLGREGDAIAIDQRFPNGHITFRNLLIVPGQRSGVMFYQRKDGRLHSGFTFEDCHILGAYDFETGQGRRTKWGVWGHMLEDFRFAGVQEPARIERISEEHAFYLQNPQGAITIENVHARDLGRTFCQFTARGAEGPPGRGDVVVKDCLVEDACISEGDGFKGGSAFTIAGRLTGTLVFEHNVYRAGFRKEREHFKLPGQVYGTGAFAAWEADREGQNGTVILRDNEFRFATGCGDRPVVSIGGCQRVLVTGRNRFVSGGTQPALALDPVNLQGRPVSTPNGQVYLAPATQLEGELTVGGKPPSEEQLERLRRQGSGTPRSAPGQGAAPGQGGVQDS